MLGGEAGREVTRASERSRQHESVVERLRGRPRCTSRPCRRPRIDCCLRSPPCRRRSRRSRASSADHQDRPHPHTGCDAAYARPGILGYAAQVKHGCERVRTALNDLYPLAQGGTAVGTGLNADPRFGELVAKIISTLTSLPFTSAPNKFEALAAHDAFVFLHGALTSVATALFKIANDIGCLVQVRAPASAN